MWTRTTRLLTAVLLLGALTVAATGPVSATPPDQSGNVERFEVHLGLVYEDGDHAVVTGPPFSQGCFDEGFPHTTIQVVSRGNDSFSETLRIRDIDVMVFEWEGDVFDLIDASCEALPEVFLEPVAVGVGQHSFKVSGDENGVHIRNSLTAKVVTADGQRAHVNTFASFDDGPGGLENLVQRINYTG